MAHLYAGISATHYVKAKADIHSYADCINFLAGEMDKRLASNVRILLYGPTGGPYECRVRLYHTDILTYYPDGTFDFTNGGFATRTTSTRCNQFGPKGWFFSHSDFKLYAFHPQMGSFVMGTRLPVDPSSAAFSLEQREEKA